MRDIINEQEQLDKGDPANIQILSLHEVLHR